MYPIATLCRVLGVSTSGYYAWRARGPSARALRDRELTQQIRRSHERSGGTYGSPRIHADLADAGERVGRKRVARLMRAKGLEGASRRKRTPHRRHSALGQISPATFERRSAEQEREAA